MSLTFFPVADANGDNHNLAVDQWTEGSDVLFAAIGPNDTVARHDIAAGVGADTTVKTGEGYVAGVILLGTAGGSDIILSDGAEEFGRILAGSNADFYPFPTHFTTDLVISGDSGNPAMAVPFR